MDGNRDEALRCISIARLALGSGDKERAQRFILKAKRLYPDLSVGDLISTSHEEAGEQATDTEQASSTYGVVEKDNSVSAPSENGDESSCHQRKENTNSEQTQIVSHIRNATDYYELLGLDKDCSVAEVRKAYRKISLKVHPDKNKSAGAEEAFKAVSKAFNCLNNSELREKYDREGVDNACKHSYEQDMRQYKGDGFYEDTSELDDAFAQFFFGMNQPNARSERAHFFWTPRRDGVGGNRPRELHFLGLIKFLVVLVVVFFNFMPNSQPLYTFQREASYQYQHLTKNHGVSFLVRNADFDQKYPPGSHSRDRIETSVERAYRDILAHNCRVEVGLHMWGRAQETPNCDALQQFQRAA
eukprot:Gb_13451 [translate_table: standard]